MDLPGAKNCSIIKKSQNRQKNSTFKGIIDEINLVTLGSLKIYRAI